MGTITIRNIDEHLNATLKEFAKKNSLSLNKWLLQVLNKITGNEKNAQFEQHHDLDSLAGGWSQNDALKFNQNTALFETIDEELWK